MKHLIIIGARGFGREVLSFARNNQPFQKVKYEIKGFLDDKTDALDGLRGDFPPILGSVEGYQIQPDDVFICALGDGEMRKKYSDMILAKGGEFISLVSKSAWINQNAKIGKGCIINGWTSISDNVDVGDFTVIHPFCDIGHDAKIGAFNSIEAYCFMGGYAYTGDYTTLHVRSTIIRHKGVGAHVSVGASSVVMRKFGDDLHVFGNPAVRLKF